MRLRNEGTIAGLLMYMMNNGGGGTSIFHHKLQAMTGVHKCALYTTKRKEQRTKVSLPPDLRKNTWKMR